MRILHLILTAVFVVLAAAPAVAQQYHFHTYNEVDGLPSSTVLDIAQDQHGFIWFATARGLSRFDGVEWDHFGSFGSRQTSKHIFVGRDNRDRMWTVSLGGRLTVSVYDESVWREIELPEDKFFERHHTSFALGETPNGDPFLAMANRHGVVAVWCTGQWRFFQTGTKLGNMAFAGGGLNVATTEGLYVIDPATWTVSPTTLTEPITAVAAAFDGIGLWVVGNDWVGIGAPDNMQVLADDLRLELVAPSEGSSALADQTGGLYFGDQSQVYFFHPRYGLEQVARVNGLQSLGATNFLLDREGHVWVAGLRGVSKLTNRSLAGYDTRHGLLDDEVSAILIKRDGQMVLGHFGGLTFLNSPPHTVAFGYDNPNLERVSDLAESPTGEVWFAADRLGVGKILPDGTAGFLPPEAGLSPGAYSLLFDRKGQMWVGTNQFLQRYNGQNFETVDFTEFAGQRALLIRRIVEASDGSIYIASGHFGVFRLKDGVLKSFSTVPGERTQNAYCLFETAAGEMLVGTVAGLCMIRGDELVKVAAPWPEIERPVYGILADARGRIWFGTDNGVLRWDGQDVVHLTNRDGLLGTETNRDALKMGPNRDIWIGTDRGLTVYRAEFDEPILAPPLLEITSVAFDGKPHDVVEPARLTGPVMAIDVKFRGVTFKDESHIRFMTWLENFEETWQGPDLLPGRSVRYTNVPPGTYRFHVRMQTAQGKFTSTASSMEIVILPPLTARWWFVLMVAAAVLVFLWLFASFMSGRRYAKRMKVQVHERTAELERSEKNVRDESRRLAATLTSISDGVITLDSVDRVVMCNSAAEQMLGCGEHNLQGRELAEVMDVTPRVSLRAGAPTIHTLSGDEGRLSWIEISVAPLAGSNEQARGTVLAFRDITARREMDNQRVRAQQLESLGVLAGGIAHDFNNLLTIILGNVSLVEEATEIGPREHSQLNKVKTATETARNLTEQFLTFAKGGDPDLMPTSLPHVIRQAATLALSGASASCKLDLAPDLWNVEVDRGQMGQVLNNLFLNASQAMDGGGTVFVRGRNTQLGNENWVQLEVHDQGSGMAKEELARIFDPYYTTKEQGTGLGLAIAHSIVRRHGGRLSVISEPGQGSVFTLALPATSVPVQDDLPPAETVELPPSRILVMDDEKDLLDVCGRLLQGLGQTCVVTTDGRQALQMYESAMAVDMRFDAVIMDLTVPGGMGGKEAVQLLLEIDPRAAVIVSSGYSNDPVLANCRQYGFQGALKKPFDKAALKQVLARVLATRESNT